MKQGVKPKQKKEPWHEQEHNAHENMTGNRKQTGT